MPGRMALAKRPALRGTGHDFLQFRGGLDQTVRPWFAVPGSLRESQNWEISINGGYSTIQGYERYDGRPAPSDATYSILDVTVDPGGSFSIGDTVDGDTSTASGVVIAMDLAADTPYLVLTKVSGTFDVGGEPLSVAAAQQGVSTGAARIAGASTAELHAQYKNLAADEYRGDIAAPTGEDAILGVWQYNGEDYCFRNAAGGATAKMWKATTGGWTEVALGYEVSFTAGSGSIADGQTLTETAGGENGTIARLVIESGTLGAGTAAGRIILATSPGFDGGAATTSGGGTLTLSGPETAITLQPDGRYEFVNENFGPALRMYGVDGVNRGFEFDGTVFVPIETGMDANPGHTDAPEHLAAFQNHLFYSFDHSLQHSATGDVYAWDPVVGAGEINAGRNITALQIQPGVQSGGVLGVYGDDLTHLLHGTSVSDWTLVRYRQSVGAYAYTVQQIADTLMVDSQGLVNFQTSQDFGDFQHSALTKAVQDFMNSRRGDATASCIVRDKNQYRVFFSDQYALYVTMDGRKVMGFMPCLFGVAVNCISSQEDESTGLEKMLFGGQDGMVYQLDRGTSFDGDAIEAFIRLHYYNASSPRIEKAYHGMTVEIEGEGYAELSFTYELGYGRTEIAQPDSETIDLSLDARPEWDVFTWDVFYWDGVTLSPTSLPIGGTAENISLIYSTNSDYFEPITLSGALIEYTKLRRMAAGEA